MTPRQIHALRKRHIEQMQREEILFGNIAAATCNFSFSPPDEPLSAEDFMMHPFVRPPITPEQAGDLALATLRTLPGALAIETTDRE